MPERMDLSRAADTMGKPGLGTRPCGAMRRAASNRDGVPNHPTADIDRPASGSTSRAPSRNEAGPIRDGERDFP